MDLLKKDELRPFCFESDKGFLLIGFSSSHVQRTEDNKISQVAVTHAASTIRKFSSFTPYCDPSSVKCEEK
jgi:hypothetical protein